MVSNTDSDNKLVSSPFRQLYESKKIRAIDYSFAEFIYGQESSLPAEQALCIAMLAAYVSVRTGEQHTCVNLDELGQPWPKIYHFPEQEQLRNFAENSKTLALLKYYDIEMTDIGYPLVLDGKSVYLQRYWAYEVRLAAKIVHFTKQKIKLDLDFAKTNLALLFNDKSTIKANELDWQKIAVSIAISQKLCFITGGPGTGKTTTVTKLLALLQGLAAKKQQILNIQLVAPTGKAAARLTESISAAKEKLPAALQSNLPTQCQTIHRLLGAKPLSPYFKANEEHQLPLDVLVIDEASMVDLPLMSKLFMALPENAQVIMLGDQEQLASVETGSVLSDICASNSQQLLPQYSPELCQQLSTLMPELTVSSLSQQTPASSLVADNLVKLMKSHRFGQHSGIGKLATLIQQGDINGVQSLLMHPDFDDVKWKTISENSSQFNYLKVSEKIIGELISKLLPIFKLYCQAIQQKDVRLAFHCLSQQQVLCAQRSGYWGVEQINQLVEKELEKQDLINLTADFYIGRPVMLSKNEHQLNLFNGDMGVVMADPKQPELIKVWFLTPEGGIRGVLPSRLPTLDTVYAMTIHKSQGSEFENVHLCLPLLLDRNSGMRLSKELLYTGLTRAKKRFTLYCQPNALALSLTQKCTRTSGLAERLCV